MSSPAERFAAARRRNSHRRLSDFSDSLPFGLDDFQVEACAALDAGEGVLVAAPTGAGKTIVGQFAVHLALSEGRKCFYTTPIKALSNQKYGELVARHGADNVGLLTGDNAVNSHANVVVMTTEVLRNMLYANSPALDGLGYVVMDEVHYLADRFRGAVWEEVMIHLPEDVVVASLSATVSNAEEFGEWLNEVRGRTRIVVSEHRPVPLHQHMLVGDRLLELFGSKDVNPELVRLVRGAERGQEGQFGRRGRPHRPRTPSRPHVVDDLASAGLLPAIYFIFSRVGCDAAVGACQRAGLRLLSDAEREQVRRRVDERLEAFADADLAVLGYGDWVDGLERGIAAHHAGLLPVFKEVVEELFADGLVKVVFATETLALGINMPARSVVLERLVKWNGESHADVTPGEYTQLTGRAGRRGIDVEGHAVVVWSSGMDPGHVAGLASTRTYPLRSSFRPTYNMAVNLVGQVGRDAARTLLESSFAQFQADRSVVGLARQAARHRESIEQMTQEMTCHLGDFTEYMALRGAQADRESTLSRRGALERRAASAAALTALRPGEVVRVPSGRYAGLAIVLDVSDPGDGPRPTVITRDRQLRRLSLVDFPQPVEPLGRVRLPRGFNPRDPQSRRDLVSSLRALNLDDAPGGRPRPRSAAADDRELARLRAAVRAHPCHGCADREDHARVGERRAKLQRELAGLDERVRSRTHTVARTFDRVCAVLESLGYLDDEQVTPAGARLARIYAEADLLLAETLREQLLDGLDAPSLAAVVSALVYASREREPDQPTIPTAAVRTALADITRLWGRLRLLESDHNLSTLPEPDPGFALAIYQWASGGRLDRVLAESSLAPGDFVRWARQLLDLLDQLALVADGAVATAARAAHRQIARGVVSYSSLL